jgi:hypothetical protein
MGQEVKPCLSTGSSARVIILALLILATTVGTLMAAQVPARFVAGALHGFLVLRTVDGVELAQGDLLQVSQDGELRSHMKFLFNDGSTTDETVVFTQRRVFTMRSYRLVQRGRAFPEETEFSLERATGKYRVTTKAREDGREKTVEGTLELPAFVRVEGPFYMKGPVWRIELTSPRWPE